MSLTTWPALCAQLAIAAAVGAGLVAACRWITDRSALCGRLVAAGLLLRAASALALFWTSFLQLPILGRLHSGDGFWNLAIDARAYYHWAFNAALNGLDTLPAATQSVAFVKVLAWWLRAVGSSPMSGPYLNLVLYVLLCVLVVACFKPTGNWRDDLPCAVTLAAMSLSPVLVLQSSQTLKDTTFVFLLGVLCISAVEFLPPLIIKGRVTRRSSVVGLGTVAAFLAALYGIAGIRAYYVVLAWSALALVLFVFAWRQRPARLVGYTAVSVLVLTAGWLSYMAGAAGADYVNPYGNVIPPTWPIIKPTTPVPKDQSTISRVAGSMLTIVDTSRRGFVNTPGATNIGPTPVSRPIPGGGLSDRLSAVRLGLGLIFVPVSLLRALSIVDFPGGRGLLAITDADTLFMDLTIVAVVAVLVRRRSTIREHLPYVCFASTLAIAAGLLMAYIVTNFGTLFRLRSMVAVPFWMLPLALPNRIVGPLEGTPPPASSVTAEGTRPA